AVSMLLQQREAPRGNIWCLALSGDGKRIAAGSDDRNIYVLDVASRETRKVLRGHSGKATAVRFSPDDAVLASGSIDKTIRLWHISAEKRPSVLTKHTGRVYALCFTPDGKTLFSGGGDRLNKTLAGELFCWSVADEKVERTLEGHSKTILCLAV